MRICFFLFSTFLYLVSINVKLIECHGRMIQPPGRSTAWRYGFRTPINYNDNELFCGGRERQWFKNGGKCGICGDPYDGTRKHELPNGEYTRNLAITETYRQGSQIQVAIQITANHRGYFTFKLCPATTLAKEVTQECLDRNTLVVLGSSNIFRYYLPTFSPQVYKVNLQLPPSLSCDRCVLQWIYTAGNNPGRCPDGTQSAECFREQETFMACADVRIIASGNTNGTPENTTTKKPLKSKKPSTNSSKRPTYKPQTIFPTTKRTYWTKKATRKPAEEMTTHGSKDHKTIDHKRCYAVGAFKNNAAMDVWCVNNCRLGYCPRSHCQCSER